MRRRTGSAWPGSPAGAAWSDYDAAFSGALEQAAARGITHVIFGDILFEEHRLWAERICARRRPDRRRAAVGRVDGRPVRRMGLVGQRGGDRHGARRAPGRVVARPRAPPRTCSRSCGASASTPAANAASTTRSSRARPLFSAPLRWRSEGHVLRSGCWALDVGGGSVIEARGALVRLSARRADDPARCLARRPPRRRRRPAGTERLRQDDAASAAERDADAARRPGAARRDGRSRR